MKQVRHRISTAEVSKQTGLSTVTIWRKTKEDPTFPKPVYIGGKKLFYQDGITEWIESNERTEPEFNNLARGAQ